MECKDIFYMLVIYVVLKFYKKGVWNQPAVDSSADIFTFCCNLEKKCLKLGVQILTSMEVTNVIKEGNQIAGVEAVKIDHATGKSS